MTNADMAPQNAGSDTPADVRREIEAREQMVAARREQQRLSILRTLSGCRR